MACIYEVTHDKGVSDVNLERRLKEMFIQRHKEDEARQEAESKSRECRWIGA